MQSQTPKSQPFVHVNVVFVLFCFVMLYLSLCTICEMLTQRMLLIRLVAAVAVVVEVIFLLSLLIRLRAKIHIQIV